MGSRQFGLAHGITTCYYRLEKSGRALTNIVTERKIIELLYNRDRLITLGVGELEINIMFAQNHLVFVACLAKTRNKHLL